MVTTRRPRQLAKCHKLLVPWPNGSSERCEGRLSRYPVPVVSAGGRLEQFWLRQECPHFDIVHQHFLCRPHLYSSNFVNTNAFCCNHFCAVFRVTEVCIFTYILYCILCTASSKLSSFYMGKLRSTSQTKISFGQSRSTRPELIPNCS